MNQETIVKINISNRSKSHKIIFEKTSKINKNNHFGIIVLSFFKNSKRFVFYAYHWSYELCTQPTLKTMRLITLLYTSCNICQCFNTAFDVQISKLRNARVRSHKHERSLTHLFVAFRSFVGIHLNCQTS